MVVLRAEPYGAMRTHTGPLRVHMHVTTTSHNAYEWPQAAGLGESYGPVILVFFGIVWAPYGPLRMSYGLVNTCMQTDHIQS